VKTVSVIFRRNHTLGSILLRVAMWSKWAHCGVIHGNEVIEASAVGGVVRTPYDAFIKNSSCHEIVGFYLQDAVADAVVQNMLSQLGKPYDWTGILGIAFRQRNWHDKDKWSCAELVAWAFEKAGRPLVRAGSWRVNPQQIYLPIFG